MQVSDEHFRGRTVIAADGQPIGEAAALYMRLFPRLRLPEPTYTNTPGCSPVFTSLNPLLELSRIELGIARL